MRDGGLSAAEEAYAPHKTTRDFVWNTLGAATWALVFPVVTMVSTQLVGTEVAGRISMAFVVGILLMFLGNFGIRTYQVSDIARKHSFLDYQINRVATCILMLFVGWLYCLARGYDADMFSIAMAVICYKCVDALADVYEGRLQQVDKLYLAGISQTIRSVLAIIVFIVLLFVTRSAFASCLAVAIAAFASFLFVTWPLALLETPKSRPFSLRSCIELLRLSAPLFLALFFFNIIENMPKFAMEGTLPYDNQLYFNAIYFPAQMILIASQLVYKPMLLRMAGVWQESDKRRKFNLLIAGIFAAIAVITLAFMAIMNWVGIDVMNFLYGIDFFKYRLLIFLMLLTGGITAAIDFLFQIVTIMRRQREVIVAFIITFAFSLFVPVLLIRYAELEGAVLSYVIVECILFALISWEYARIRHALHGKTIVADEGTAQASQSTPEGDLSQEHRERTQFMPLMDLGDPEIGEAESIDEGLANGVDEPADQGEQKKKRPSEIRAEREHREEVMRKWTHRR